jgi:N-acetylglucosaminyl-diphospho-decaprenol L-rhamnosyltransferase
MSRLTIVIVTWNSSGHLPAFFTHLTAALSGVDDYQVIVADNDSRDDTAARAQELWPSVRLVHTGGNLGYASAINAAVRRHARPADTVAVLNPDLRLAPDALRILLATSAERGVGIAVPRHFDAEGESVASLRRQPTLARVWSEALIGCRLASPLGLSELILDPDAYEHAQDVDWASGAAMVIAPACRAATGGWDESFFLYSEEVDYCRRARDAGFSIRYDPRASTTHEGGDFATDPVLWAHLVRNRGREFARRSAPLAAALFWAGLAVGEAVRSPGKPVRRAGFRAALNHSDEGPRGTGP